MALEIPLCYISGASHLCPILKTQDLTNSARFCQVGRPEAAFVVELNGRVSPAGYWSHLGLEQEAGKPGTQYSKETPLLLQPLLPLRACMRARTHTGSAHSKCSGNICEMNE